MNIKSYSGLSQLNTFKDRFDYLMIGGLIGERTFGGNRYLNQRFYSSKEWRKFRDKIIIRDNGCDMGLDGYQLSWKITVHHIVPISEEDILSRSSMLFDPENAVCVSYDTHKAIHYGIADMLIPKVVMARSPNDTCPWKERICL